MKALTNLFWDYLGILLLRVWKTIRALRNVFWWPVDTVFRPSKTCLIPIHQPRSDLRLSWSVSERFRNRVHATTYASLDCATFLHNMGLV